MCDTKKSYSGRASGARTAVRVLETLLTYSVFRKVGYLLNKAGISSSSNNSYVSRSHHHSLKQYDLSFSGKCF